MEIGVQAAAHKDDQNGNSISRNDNNKNNNVEHLIFILMFVSFIYFKKFYANLKIYYPIMNWVVYGCLSLSYTQPTLINIRAQRMAWNEEKETLILKL